MAKKHNRANSDWYVMDVHIHTPASNDFQQPEVTYLEILQRAETRGLEIIAFTDHNTVAGYRRFKDELQQLELLERIGRILPEERQRLGEYRRLLENILILPGFEVTATFGFHIIGVFPPDKPVREIEHLLLTMNIPSPLLDDGSSNVGATTDVLNAYRLINQAGGLVIAAHSNSSNGVAMRGFNFGGQTKIAYTQDPNLNALEVTDLELKGPRSTAGFFNGTKPEYPRRMHCIQGSDAHRLSMDPLRKKNLGVGDRATEVLLPEPTFEALHDLFLGNDFSRTRPHRFTEEPAYDFLQAAIDQGANIIQDFHESLTVRGGKLYAILADVCAFANTNGGALYIGLTSDSKKPPIGVSEPEQAINNIEKEINSRITPTLACTIDTHEYKSKKLLRILVPRGEDAPYALDDNKIYVRDEDETGLAVRDEIVGLVMRGKPNVSAASASPVVPSTSEEDQHKPIEAPAIIPSQPADTAPRTGVELMLPEERTGGKYFTMRDLRNGNVVKNVTRASARRLWHYAISRFTEMGSTPETSVTQWEGNIGLMRKHRQGRTTMFDFIERTQDGFRYYFGVTPDGIHGAWKIFSEEDED